MLPPVQHASLHTKSSGMRGALYALQPASGPDAEQSQAGILIPCPASKSQRGTYLQQGLVRRHQIGGHSQRCLQVLGPAHTLMLSVMNDAPAADEPDIMPGNCFASHGHQGVHLC